MIRFQRPEIPPAAAIEAYYHRAEDARWYSNFGPCHTLLEERLEAYVGRGMHVVPLANCTLALMLGLRVLTADRRGDEVLMPSFTFAATAGAAVWAGLRPVFVDVDPETWMLDPAALRRALQVRRDRVACVLACSTFGTPPRKETAAAWTAAVADAGVPLLVDSAAGFGARDADGLPLGALGDMEVFSLHATKPFGIGEGGLACTADADRAAALRRLANFGFEDGMVTDAIGLNAKLAEWPAATALAVLDRLEAILGARRTHVDALREALQPAGLEFQASDGQSTWQFLPTVAADAAARNVVRDSAIAAGVEVRTYFDPPLHQMPAFAGMLRADELAVTTDLSSRVLSLPMANDLTPDEIGTIIAAVGAALREVALP
ncbi:MAG TPA: aminotransferase class I/II-fold pyridoxal phosphate-dependent enzyme [Baekduia sp.]|uniref:DegT/DnrJ/EryC1/StrS family aminotransferase n=1 Tax=Baekduia sp. TaxID=2600305 RepID=UPI002CFF0E15|nr:aminotransferase class I/II-fold pyridoxal phosphate-dependent enzyme [Baekduia sp.]HMJ36432.1 aminotransferase class I/II-fold pyridoxal phosphate-dependent enzyme [Baekduia sp.]